MRLWSIHPKYLDSKGLVALWRESLLAKNVLQGNTRGYKNHPQLIRFKNLNDPFSGINSYLNSVYEESLSRGYSFDANKIDGISKVEKIAVSDGQIKYEFQHLLTKLQKRDPDLYTRYKDVEEIVPNPIFYIIDGDIAKWEKVQ